MPTRGFFDFILFCKHLRLYIKPEFLKLQYFLDKLFLKNFLEDKIIAKYSEKQGGVTNATPPCFLNIKLVGFSVFCPFLHTQISR